MRAEPDNCSRSERVGQRLLFGFFALVTLCGLMQTLGTIRADGPAIDVPTIRLDPNRASWSELALLPGIGEVLARRIVAARSGHASSPAFCTPNDLTSVERIGPVTAGKLAPFLQFPPACRDH